MEKQKKSEWKQTVLVILLISVAAIAMTLFSIWYLKMQDERAITKTNKEKAYAKERVAEFKETYERELEKYLKDEMSYPTVDDLKVELQPTRLDAKDVEEWNNPAPYKYYFNLWIHSKSVEKSAARAEKSKKLSDCKSYIKKMRTLNELCDDYSLKYEFEDLLESAFGEHIYCTHDYDIGYVYELEIDDYYKIAIVVNGFPEYGFQITTEDGDTYRMYEDTDECILFENEDIFKKIERKNTDYEFWDKRCLKEEKDDTTSDNWNDTIADDEDEYSQGGSGGPEIPAGDDSDENQSKKKSSKKKKKSTEDEHEDSDYDNEEELYEDNKKDFDDEDDAADYLEDEWEWEDEE